MYHRIAACRSGERFVVTRRAFEQQMLALRSSGRPIVPLHEIAHAANGMGTVADNAVAVSFDDGHEEFYRHGLATLAGLEIPATMFVVAGKLSGTDDWMPLGIPRTPLMSAEQIRELPAHGVAVGSHSLTHARLTELDDTTLGRELVESRERLAEVLGCPVNLLAYPYGLHDERVVRAAGEAGYVGACSTRSGFNASGVNPLVLRRIDVSGTDSLRAFRHKLELGVNDGSLRAQIGYLAGRAFRKFRGSARQGGRT